MRVSRWVISSTTDCPGSQSLGNLKRSSFCLCVVVSQLLWRWVGWELPGYFRLIFYFCVTRFSNSVTHEISVTVRFILCETTMACFLLGRLFNSLTAGIVLVVSSDMWGSDSPQNSNPYVMAKLDVTLHTTAGGVVCVLLIRTLASWPNSGVDILCRNVVIK